MGCWVNVKMDPTLRPSLYRLLIPLMHPREDLVVRLTCAESLRLCECNLFSQCTISYNNIVLCSDVCDC